MDFGSNELGQALYAAHSTSAWVLSLILGLIIGSFLNVVIGRLPRMLSLQWQADCASTLNKPPQQLELSLAKPGSHCPHCQHAVRWYDNIPVFSWLVLRARCRDCRQPISVRYPLIELLTGVLFALLGWSYGLLTAEFYFYAIATALLISMFFIDLDEMLLPDQLTLSFLWLGLLFAVVGGPIPPTTAIIGAIAGYLSLWSVYWAFKLLTGKEGMGYGDFKLLAGLGAWLGWQQLPVLVILAAVTGAVLGIIWQLIQRQQRGQPIPFGPFLIFGGLTAWAYGETLLNAYWRWLIG